MVVGGYDSVSADAELYGPTIVVNPPTGLSATSTSSMQINLLWSDNSSDEADFHIERSLSGTGSWGEIGIVNAGLTSYSNTDLTCGTTYYYRVRAHRHSDGIYSNYSNTANTTTSPCPFHKASPANSAPGQPTNPTLSWASSSGATSYEYCYDTTNDGIACGGAWTSTGASTNVSLSGLIAGTTYYWQVRARNSAGTTEADPDFFGPAWWSFTTSQIPPIVLYNYANYTGASCAFYAEGTQNLVGVCNDQASSMLVASLAGQFDCSGIRMQLVRPGVLLPATATSPATRSRMASHLMITFHRSHCTIRLLALAYRRASSTRAIRLTGRPAYQRIPL